LITTSSFTEFIDIPKQYLIDSLLHDTANNVSKWAEVRADGATDLRR